MATSPVRIVRELADTEVRRYVAYTVAEVMVAGPESDAGNQALPTPAGYSFGKNKGEKKFAMTAPVTQAAVPVKLEMTITDLHVKATHGIQGLLRHARRRAHRDAG